MFVVLAILRIEITPLKHLIPGPGKVFFRYILGEYPYPTRVGKVFNFLGREGGKNTIEEIIILSMYISLLVNVQFNFKIILGFDLIFNRYLKKLDKKVVNII